MLCSKLTIIIPVYNDANRLLCCINALKKQTYPKELLEIIVVDNGSDDNLSQVIDNDIKLFQELEIKSSYAARNKGIINASGDVIVFTDSDCVPCERWIEEGIRGLQDQQADMLSGNVKFNLSLPPTGAELWDAVTNMQIADNIRQRSVSKTANLFVRKSVFDSVGLFPRDLRSGGDVLWTSQATSAGFKLVYHADAEIEHPARRLKELLAKQFRVGQGHAAHIKDLNIGKKLGKIAFRALPIRLRTIQRLLNKKEYKTSKILLMRVWGAACICRFTTALGTVCGLFFRSY